MAAEMEEDGRKMWDAEMDADIGDGTFPFSGRLCGLGDDAISPALVVALVG